MTWLTWRQHRSSAALVGAMLLVLSVAVICLTIASAGPLGEVARTCAGVQYGFCTTPQAWFSSNLNNWWGLVLMAVVVVPVLIGMSVGAPLIPRELEGGTHLLAWSQGMTRGRWFLVRASLLVVGAAVAAAVLAAIAQGWFAMERDLGSGNGFLTIWSGFDIAPPVVIAYTLFALALGIAAGAALRRTQPAMAVTLVAYIAVRVSIAVLARWRYLPPVVFRELAGGQPAAGTPAPGPGDWLLPAPPGFFDAAGHPVNAVSVSQLISQCTGNTQATCPRALAGVYSLTQYQPASRFWLFQGIEAAIFVLLALALFALAYRLVRRIR